MEDPGAPVAARPVPPSNAKRGSVTMNDVARRAGVSLKTVSNVVNDFPHVRPQTREKVQRAIGDLGYQINISAQSLRRGKTGVIGLAIPFISQPYFGELAQMMMREAEKQGLSVLIELTDGDRRKELEVLSSPRRMMTDGLLFSPVSMNPSDLPALAVDYPLVMLGERLFGGPVDHVTMANVDGARAATHFLYSRGARRIAVLGHKPQDTISSAVLRMDGYRRALVELGLEFDPHLVLETPEWSRSYGSAAMSAAMEANIEFDAVFAMNDVLAIGGLHVLAQYGVSVPDDVQVIGFDNIEEASYMVPGLTTVDPGVSQIVETAIRMVKSQIDEEEKRGPQLSVAGFDVIERGTTKTV